MSEPKGNICNLCGEVAKTAKTRMQYPGAFACDRCYRLWKRGHK